MGTAGALSNPRAVWLVSIYAYAVLAGVERILRFSTRDYITKPLSTPANTHWQPYAEHPFVFEQQMFSRGSSLFGPATPNYGTCQINYDELGTVNGVAFPEMLSLEFSKRRILIQRGEANDDISAFVTVHDGFISERPQLSGGKLSFNYSGAEELLKEPVQANQYAGSNGISGTAKEGDEALEGQPKIRTLGTVIGMEPVLVNAVGQIHQVNDGKVKSISNAEVEGNPLTYAGDLTGAAFDNWVKVPGHWVSDVARGYLMTGSPIASGNRLTVDCEGHMDGAKFYSSHSEIIGYLIEHMGITNVDTAAFSAHHAADGGKAGVVIKDDITAQDLIGQLLVSCGSFGGENSSQQYTIGKVDSPAASASYDLGIYVKNVQLVRTSEPYWRMRFAYGLTGEELEVKARKSKPAGPTQAGVITSALGANDKNAPKQESFGTDRGETVSNTVPNSATFRSIYKGAIEGEVLRTFYKDRADALAELDRQIAIFDTALKFWKVTTSIPDPESIRIGDTITFSWPSYGLSLGIHIVVTAIRIYAGDGITELEGFA